MNYHLLGEEKKNDQEMIAPVVLPTEMKTSSISDEARLKSKTDGIEAKPTKSSNDFNKTKKSRENLHSDPILLPTSAHAPSDSLVSKYKLSPTPPPSSKIVIVRRGSSPSLFPRHRSALFSLPARSMSPNLFISKIER